MWCGCMMHSIHTIRVAAHWYPFAKCIMDKEGNCPIYHVLMQNDLNSVETINIMEEVITIDWNGTGCNFQEMMIKGKALHCIYCIPMKWLIYWYITFLQCWYAPFLKACYLCIMCLKWHWSKHIIVHLFHAFPEATNRKDNKEMTPIQHMMKKNTYG